MGIERTVDQFMIKLSKLFNKVSEKFSLVNCDGAKTPMGTNFKTTDENKIIEMPYRELIGSLMHLTVASRLDLTYAVRYLSRYSDKPSEQVWKAGKKV